jgi:hypothetical protein
VPPLDRSGQLRALTLVTLLLGAAATAWLLQWPVPFAAAQLGPALLFAALYVALAFVEIPLGPGLTISAEPAAVALSFLMFGPAVSLVAMLIGAGLTALRRRRSPQRIVFNLSQFAACQAVLTTIYLPIVGAFGQAVPLRIIDGDLELGARYLLGTLAGMGAFIAVNNAFMWAYVTRESARELSVWRLVRDELTASPIFVLVALATTFSVAYMGWAATGLFALPGLAIIWSGGVLLRGQLVSTRFSVAERLTAFLTARDRHASHAPRPARAGLGARLRGVRRPGWRNGGRGAERPPERGRRAAGAAHRGAATATAIRARIGRARARERGHRARTRRRLAAPRHRSRLDRRGGAAARHRARDVEPLPLPPGAAAAAVLRATRPHRAAHDRL